MADEKKPGFFKRIASGIKRFFKDTKSELKKIVWPSRKTVLNNTGVVIIVLVISSMRNKRENQPPASLGLAYFREER